MTSLVQGLVILVDRPAVTTAVVLAENQVDLMATPRTEAIRPQIAEVVARQITSVIQAALSALPEVVLGGGDLEAPVTVIINCH
jgi:hypothetical protein